MPPIIQYLLKLSISLSLVYLFYQFLLRRLTFYNSNRWYLLGYSVLSFVIPFINIEPLVENRNLNEIQVIHYIPVFDNYTSTQSVVFRPNALHPVNPWDIILWLFLCGLFVMIARLFIQYASLQKIKRKAVVINEASGVHIYHVDENIIPFSFGNAIYINQNQHSEKELEDIILHEYVHVKQKHTIDILVAELLCMINWYNPFAWLIRHASRQNLEFIADNDVLKNGLDKKAYQYHLLKVIGTAQYRIANSFNLSSLKKRIAMMNKLKSARLHLVKFLFIFPLIAVLLVAFRNKYKGIFKSRVSYYNEAGLVIDASTNKALAGVIIKEVQSGLVTSTDENGFYKLKIPVQEDKISENFQLVKAGYEKSEFEYFQPGNAGGFIHVFGLFSMDSINKNKTMVFMGNDEKFNGNPEYEDVLKVLKKNIPKNDSFNHFINFIDKHPEVSQFYSVEGKKQQIVFLKNGGIEKYGYPGTASIQDMEIKYGPLPEMMQQDMHSEKTGYLNKWKKISEAAEKVFKTTNPDARMIIFPGDSRVIAVPKTGKPQVYDMDSAAPDERAAFEKLYGKLPDGVPAPANNYPAKTEMKAEKQLIKTDTVPAKANSGLKSVQYGERGKHGVIIIKTEKPDWIDKAVDTSYGEDVSVQNGMMNWRVNKDYPKPKHPLYLVDGKAVGRDERLVTIKSEDIYIMEYAVKGDPLKKYGVEGQEGLINFVTKSNQDNKEAYIFPRRGSIDSAEIKKNIAELTILDKLYLSLETPLKISAEGVPAEDLVAIMDKKYGIIRKRDGLYYASPKIPGNAEIKIFKKGKSGSLKLLNSRFFRVEYLPSPAYFKKS